MKLPYSLNSTREKVKETLMMKKLEEVNKTAETPVKINTTIVEYFYSKNEKFVDR